MEGNMKAVESDVILEEIRRRQEKIEMLRLEREDDFDGFYIRLRALLVALLGMSVSACAFASQPVEMGLDDEELLQRLNSLNVARRFTKPLIRFVLGPNKLSALVTAMSSLLLMMAVMSKQAWWHHGARWLAAPALLVCGLEVAADAADALLSTALLAGASPAHAFVHAVGATVLLAMEIILWYFIAKFFEHNPPAELATDDIKQMASAPFLHQY